MPQPVEEFVWTDYAVSGLIVLLTVYAVARLVSAYRSEKIEGVYETSVVARVLLVVHSISLYEPRISLFVLHMRYQTVVPLYDPMAQTTLVLLILCVGFTISAFERWANPMRGLPIGWFIVSGIFPAVAYVAVYVMPWIGSRHAISASTIVCYAYIVMVTVLFVLSVFIPGARFCKDASVSPLFASRKRDIRCAAAGLFGVAILVAAVIVVTFIRFTLYLNADYVVTTVLNSIWHFLSFFCGLVLDIFDALRKRISSDIRRGLSENHSLASHLYSW